MLCFASAVLSFARGSGHFPGLLGQKEASVRDFAPKRIKTA